MLFKKHKQTSRPLVNAVTIGERVYTMADLRAINALNYARGVVPRSLIKEKRENGLLIGFNIFNEGGDTTLLSVE